MFKKNGFSLIELTVVIGIMSIAALGMMTMMDNQNKDFRFLAEKFEMRDAKSVLTGVIDENGFCGCLLSGKTLNTVTGQLNGAVTSVPLSYSTPPGCTASAQMIIPTAGSKLSASSNLTVDTITMLPGAEVIAGSAKYSATLEVKFLNATRSARPITIPMFIKVDPMLGSATARPVVSCSNGSSQVEIPPVQGFCTPMSMWDNSGALVCPARNGFISKHMTGVYGSSVWRGSGCCYIPIDAGGNGWCSPQYPSWSAFPGCATGSTNYSSVWVRAIKSGVSDQSQCCFIPNTMPKYPVAFGSDSLDAWDASNSCGGPFANWHVITHQTVTSGKGNFKSCTYAPKY